MSGLARLRGTRADEVDNGIHVVAVHGADKVLIGFHDRRTTGGDESADATEKRHGGQSRGRKPHIAPPCSPMLRAYLSPAGAGSALRSSIARSEVLIRPRGHLHP